MFCIKKCFFLLRKISTLNKWLKVKSVNVEELWTKIDEVIVKTVLAAYPMLKHSYHTCFPTHDLTYACFELLGFDILLDWKLKPYLLEVQCFLHLINLIIKILIKFIN